MQSTIQEWQEELVQCIHFLHQKGYAPATSSNYSFRPKDMPGFFISTSGVDKGRFTHEHFMEVSNNGLPVSDNRKPSAETLLHALIYKKLPDIRCVLHTHTVYNTVLSSIFKEVGHLKLEGFEILKGLSGVKTHEADVNIPIFENSQDMSALSKMIKQYWEKNPNLHGFLLSGHGLYTWGTTIAEAKRHVEVLEFLFEVRYKIQTFSLVSLSN